MAKYRITKSGITFNGQVYREGDVFDLPDDYEGETVPRQHLVQQVRAGEYDGIEAAPEEEKKAQAAEKEEEKAAQAEAEAAELEQQVEAEKLRMKTEENQKLQEEAEKAAKKTQNENKKDDKS